MQTRLPTVSSHPREGDTVPDRPLTAGTLSEEPITILVDPVNVVDGNLTMEVIEWAVMRVFPNRVWTPLGMRTDCGGAGRVEPLTLQFEDCHGDVAVGV